MKKYNALSATILSLLTIIGCIAGAQPIQGTERDTVLAYAEPKTENLLNGFNAGDN